MNLGIVSMQTSWEPIQPCTATPPNLETLYTATTMKLEYRNTPAAVKLLARRAGTWGWRRCLARILEREINDLAQILLCHDAAYPNAVHEHSRGGIYPQRRTFLHFSFDRSAVRGS